MVKIKNPVIGDKTLTVTVENSGGLDAVSFFRRAGVVEEEPTQGATRTGDGSLVVSAILVNRTFYEIFVQTKTGAGSFNPASNVLLLSPRESGISDYDAIITEISNEIKLVDNVGTVHTRQRLVRFWDDFYKKFRAPDANKRLLSDWEITRAAATQDINSPQGQGGTEPFFFDTHDIRILGRFAVSDQDPNNSESRFMKVIDDIVVRIRLNNRLNGAVLLPRNMQAPTIEHQTFGGVLCHFTEMQFEAVVRVGG